MPYVFYTLPSWLSAIFIIAFFVAFAIAGVELAHRFDATGFRRDHNDISGFVSALVGVVYAVLLASVAIIALENYDRAKDVIAREASHLGDVQRMSYGLPDEVGKAIRHKCIEYGRKVLDDEWPQMRSGKTPDAGWKSLKELQNLVVRYQPETAAQQNIHASLLTKFGDLVDARRERVVRAEDGIEDIVWFVVLLGSLGTVAFSFFFGLEKRWHKVLSGSLAASTALLIVLIADLDHPYWGIGGVSLSPQVMEQTVARIEE